MQRLRDQAHELEDTLQERTARLAEREGELPQLEQALRERIESLDSAVQRLTVTQARIQALRQIQDRIARGAELQGWLSQRELDSAPRMWQGMTIEPGWEDALEAVLRERLNALAIDPLERAAQWLTDQPPGKMTVVDASGSPTEVPPYELRRRRAAPALS
jgi:chromosome segregation protein